MGLKQDTPAHAGVALASRWRDFEVLETGDGMKKERWGDVVLVRPDPQVIWPRGSGDWGACDGVYHRDEGGLSQPRPVADGPCIYNSKL